MPFNKTTIDVSVYQGDIDWEQVKASGIYAAVIRAGYGRYASQEDLKFRQNYTRARAAGMPVGVYWYSYAKTPEQAQQEADICLQVLGDRALQMPLYMDQEWASTPAESRTACAVAFLDRIRERHSGLVGYYTYTSYFASVDIPTIQAHCDTIWLADYRQNYDKTIPHDMHQYSSSGTVSGIAGRVDMNHLYRDFPGELNKEEKPMAFEPVTGKQLRCTSAASPKCETFSAPDINASLGALELGQVCKITAKGGTIDLAGMTGTWYKILNGTAEVYCLDLPDGRCVVEDAPEAPAVDLTEVLAALARIEAKQDATDTKVQTVVDKLSAAGAALK